jgi:hypothetical protein
MVIYPTGKRKQLEDALSKSLVNSAKRKRSAKSLSENTLSKSLINLRHFGERFSDLEDKYGNQLMGAMTAENVYWC